MEIDNRLIFFRDKIKDRLKEIKDAVPESRYKLWIASIDSCTDYDELREMAELDMHISLFGYIKSEINPRIEGLSVELERLRTEQASASEQSSKKYRVPQSKKVVLKGSKDIIEQVLNNSDYDSSLFDGFMDSIDDNNTSDTKPNNSGTIAGNTENTPDNSGISVFDDPIALGSAGGGSKVITEIEEGSDNSDNSDNSGGIGCGGLSGLDLEELFGNDSEDDLDMADLDMGELLGEEYIEDEETDTDNGLDESDLNMGELLGEEYIEDEETDSDDGLDEQDSEEEYTEDEEIDTEEMPEYGLDELDGLEELLGTELDEQDLDEQDLDEQDLNIDELFGTDSDEQDLDEQDSEEEYTEDEEADTEEMLGDDLGEQDLDKLEELLGDELDEQGLEEHIEDEETDTEENIYDVEEDADGFDIDINMDELGANFSDIDMGSLLGEDLSETDQKENGEGVDDWNFDEEELSAVSSGCDIEPKERTSTRTSASAVKSSTNEKGGLRSNTVFLDGTDRGERTQRMFNGLNSLGGGIIKASKSLVNAVAGKVKQSNFLSLDADNGEQ